MDTWWQTETGMFQITPVPALPLKPGSGAKPFFGQKAQILDDHGNPVPDGEEGFLVLERPWPAMMTTIFKDPERYVKQYWSKYPGRYMAGDSAKRDKDGYFWVIGRTDDVIKVSGYRLGTAEIESALVAHEAVAEAAVVGFPHPIKGQGIYAYVLLTADYAGNDRDQIMGALKEQVRHAIGSFAAPDVVHIASGLPKTRSGKIMRRILRKIAASEYDGLGDLTTLAEPDVVDRLIQEHKTGLA
jgi:acetyl-CoA synthetase